MPNEDRQCEQCGTTFHPRHYYRPGRFCSLACYHANGTRRTKRLLSDQKMRSVPSHPIAPPSGVVAFSRLVLYEKIGAGTHPCHWCGAPVTWMPGAGLAKGALLADHLDWDRNNDAPENLVPSCNHCNVTRRRDGERRRLQGGELVVLWSGKPTRAVERECERCGEKFLIPPSATARGRGRFCSRTCARLKPKS
jgi:hypothetical protein